MKNVPLSRGSVLMVLKVLHSSKYVVSILLSGGHQRQTSKKLSTHEIAQLWDQNRFPMAVPIPLIRPHSTLVDLA